MSEEFLEVLLEREPELAEILDYFILVPEETFYDRYCCNVKSCISYNLLYDLITNERYICKSLLFISSRLSFDCIIFGVD